MCVSLRQTGGSERDAVVAQTLPYLLVRALSTNRATDVKRVHALRGCLPLFDFDDASIVSLKRLLLRCAFAPAFLKCAEGRRFLSSLLVITPTLTREIMAIVRNQIPGGRASVLQVCMRARSLRANRRSVGGPVEVGTSVRVTRATAPMGSDGARGRTNGAVLLLGCPRVFPSPCLGSPVEALPPHPTTFPPHQTSDRQTLVVSREVWIEVMRCVTTEPSNHAELHSAVGLFAALSLVRNDAHATRSHVCRASQHSRDSRSQLGAEQPTHK